MGFNLGDAVIYFRGDQSKLNEDTDNAQNKISGFVGSATSMLGGALVAGAAAAGAAVIGIGTAAFDVSQQTERATANIAAQLGIPIDKAREFGEVARAVYGNNFANDVQDAGAAVGLLAQQLGLTADDPALQTMTENAFRLRDAFGVDVAESVDAVRTLMDNFGLTSAEAFDMLTAGYQRGLDRSGDFLDTVNEYSTQFANGGASATEFFSLLDSGLEGGMLGTDKAADAFKEFRLRIVDGSDSTAQALDALEGKIDSGILRGLSDGSVTAAEAFELVVAGLNEIEDPALRMQTGAALLGTQFEDLGDDVALALTLTNDWAAGSEGAINTLDAKYATFGDAVEGVWRRLTVSISPFTDKLLELVNSVMPAVMGAFDRFDEAVGPTMQGAQQVIDSVVGYVRGLFDQFRSDADSNLTGPLQYWQEWAATNLPMVQQLFDNILNAIQTFWDIFGEHIMFVVQNTFGVIITIIDTAMRTVGDIITLALQILTGDWEGAWGTLNTIVERLLNTMLGVVGGLLENLRSLFTNIDWQAVGEAIVNGVKDGIRNAWGGLENWFRDKLQDLRDLLPFSEPKDARSPLRGLGKAGEATVEMYQEGMDRAMSGLNSVMSGGLAGLVAAPQMAGGGPMSITININGAGDAAATGRAAERGVLAALRQAGRR